MFRAFARCQQIALEAHARIQGRGFGRGVFAKKQDTRGQLYIYDVIGADGWGGGITANEVKDQLAKLNGVTALDIYINSEGGQVFEALGIYNNLKRFEAKKTVYIDGLAASAASFVAMVGDPIVTAENATWMIHEAHGFQPGMVGTASDFRSRAADDAHNAEVLDQQSKTIADIYAARTGKPSAHFWNRPTPTPANQNPASTGLMAAETWLNAAQALELKFADQIEKNSQPAAAIAAKAGARVVLAEMQQSLLNDRRRASPGRTTQRPAART